MKLRYKILYMSFGAGLVVLGMMLNSLVSGDAEAQGDGLDMTFGSITCKTLFIADGSKLRGSFGLDTEGDAMLQIFGDDEKTPVAYLGGNAVDPNGEMMLQLKSKSKTDKREVSMMIDRNGGRFQSNNKMGEGVVRIAVADDGSGVVDLRDKFGYRK